MTYRLVHLPPEPPSIFWRESHTGPSGRPNTCRCRRKLHVPLGIPISRLRGFHPPLVESRARWPHPLYASIEPISFLDPPGTRAPHVTRESAEIFGGSAGSNRRRLTMEDIRARKFRAQLARIPTHPINCAVYKSRVG